MFGDTRDICEPTLLVTFGVAIPKPPIRGVPEKNENRYVTFIIGRIELKIFLGVLGTYTNPTSLLFWSADSEPRIRGVPE